MNDRGEPILGSYSFRNFSIEVNGKYEDRVLKTLIHECGHHVDYFLYRCLLNRSNESLYMRNEETEEMTEYHRLFIDIEEFAKSFVRFVKGEEDDRANFIRKYVNLKEM